MRLNVKVGLIGGEIAAIVVTVIVWLITKDTEASRILPMPLLLFIGWAGLSILVPVMFINGLDNIDREEKIDAALKDYDRKVK